MAVVPHIALALVLVMATFSTVEMSTDAWPWRPRSRKPHLEPLSPGGYRTYIVLLNTPTAAAVAGANMDRAALIAWYESFLPSKMTRDGQRRLRHTYTALVYGFSALLTDEELKRVAGKPGFIRAFPNYIRYLDQTATRAYGWRHRRAS